MSKNVSSIPSQPPHITLPKEMVRADEDCASARTFAVVTVQDAMVAAMATRSKHDFLSRESSSAGAENSKQSETSRRWREG
jgi:hypothetical protein